MKESHRISKNVFFLGSVQALNYSIPIITIPILLNRIGLDNYGLVSLAQGIMFLLVAIADYGFNLTGTKLISQSKDNGEKKENAYKLIFAKLILVIPCFIILVLLTLMIPLWQENQKLILWSYTLVVGNALFPIWYFIGTQKTALLSLLNLLSRLLYLGAILLIIKESRDYYLVNICSGLGWLLSSIIGMILIHKDHSLTGRSVRFNLKEVLLLIKSNSSIFVSTFMNSAYRSSGVILAGFLLSPTSLGIYGILDKVLMLVANFFIVVYNAVFPRVCFLALKNKKLVTSFYKNLLPRIGILALLGSSLLVIFGARLLGWLTDEIDSTEMEIYLYLIGLFPITMLINLPFSLTFVSFDLRREFFFYNLIALLSFLLFGIILGGLYGIFGLLLSILLTEISLFTLGMYLIKSKGISFF